MISNGSSDCELADEIPYGEIKWPRGSHFDEKKREFFCLVLLLFFPIFFLMTNTCYVSYRIVFNFFLPFLFFSMWIKLIFVFTVTPKTSLYTQITGKLNKKWLKETDFVSADTRKEKETNNPSKKNILYIYYFFVTIWLTIGPSSRALGQCRRLTLVAGYNPAIREIPVFFLVFTRFVCNNPRLGCCCTFF